MKTYEALYNSEVKGVYGISLVSNPAMEENFLSFSKQEKDIKFTTVDSEKRILLGLVLEPNKLVPRCDPVTKEMYNVYFSAETIKEVAYNFQKNGYQSNSTIEHSGNKLEGVSFVETWTVENPKIDKSVNFGLEYPKGTWVAMMRVDSDDVWEKYVKTGLVKGFSIDAGVNFKEVNFNNQLNNKLEMNTQDEQESGKSIAKKLLSFFKSEVETSEEVKEEVVSESVEAKETEKVEFAIDDLEEVKEDLKEDVKIEVSQINGLEEFVAKLFMQMKDDLGNLSKENESLKVELSALKESVIELGKQPASASISSAPVQVEYSKMTNFEKMQHNRNK
jgi:negative regulator of replication initiation